MGTQSTITARVEVQLLTFTRTTNPNSTIPVVTYSWYYLNPEATLTVRVTDGLYNVTGYFPLARVGSEEKFTLSLLLAFRSLPFVTTDAIINNERGEIVPAFRGVVRITNPSVPTVNLPAVTRIGAEPSIVFLPDYTLRAVKDGNAYTGSPDFIKSEASMLSDGTAVITVRDFYATNRRTSGGRFYESTIEPEVDVVSVPLRPSLDAEGNLQYIMTPDTTFLSRANTIRTMSRDDAPGCTFSSYACGATASATDGGSITFRPTETVVIPWRNLRRWVPNEETSDLP